MAGDRGHRNGGSRGGGRGSGRGSSRGGRGKGGRRGYVVAEDVSEPKEKTLPTFTKIEKLRNGSSSFLVVKVKNIDEEATYQPYKTARTRQLQCTEALVGDDTGCILLSTRQADLVEKLKANENKYVCLLNVTMHSGNGKARLEAAQFSTVKPVAECTDILPEDQKEPSFDINESNDRSIRKPPKPTWTPVSGLEPELKHLNTIVKIVEAEITERPKIDGTLSKLAECYVGDSAAGVKMIVRNDHVDKIKEGAVVVIFNAHVTMYDDTFIRLVVDRWSSVKAISEVEEDILPENVPNAETNPPDKTIPKKNRSLIEWVLQ